MSGEFRTTIMNELNRRSFLVRAGTGLSTAWMATHWPALLSAATHARNAAKAVALPKFEFLTPEEAVEVAAITSRLIPSDDSPGAKEAGVVYFIDRGLITFDTDNQKTYREGLPELHARVTEMFPNAKKFSELKTDDQDEVLHSFDQSASSGRRRPFRVRPGAQNFFDTVLQHTIAGYLIGPDYGANHDGVGWKLIGRENEHMFQAPFGYYDKDYPGWKPSEDAQKK